MNPARDTILLAARNRWLAEHLPRYRFVRAAATPVDRPSPWISPARYTV